jgi:hypothetical protein
MYMQADQMDKAAAVMDKLRSGGQLTEEREYKQLYSIYANTDTRKRTSSRSSTKGCRRAS